ncbi:sperm microtubule inner protein 11 [Brachyhypopomus gauderio]|uniref:sperm microtubule inner protein 11 n=1 Tax=Brachyhypopomus gauderio TaxID=698409 RepID=UPI004041EBEF
MAFFGITNLGYQNPFGDRMLSSSLKTPDSQEGRWEKVPPLVSSPRRPTCTETCSVHIQPAPSSVDTHQGSQTRYREMIRRVQTPRAPNQLYCVPITDNQRYGWWFSVNETRTCDSWTKVHRFPRKNSEMTKFVKEMSMTNREFSLF